MVINSLCFQEALEVLRTTSNKVELVVCRLPSESTGNSPDIPLPPPPPPVRREPPPPLRILNPLPPLQIEPCGVSNGNFISCFHLFYTLATVLLKLMQNNFTFNPI